METKLGSPQSFFLNPQLREAEAGSPPQLLFSATSTSSCMPLRQEAHFQQVHLRL